MDADEQEKRIAQIEAVLQARETEDLQAIWERNDRQEWSDEAFEAIRRILIVRLGTVPPPQNVHASEAPAAEPEADDDARIAEAEEHLDKAAEHAEAEDLEAALQECELAVQVAPHFAEARNDRGLVLVEMGRLEEAIAEYREAIRLNPRYFKARGNLSSARVKLKEARYLAGPVEIKESEEGGETDVAREADAPSEAGSQERDSARDEAVATVEASLDDDAERLGHLDGKALALRGWPGHRTRPGRTGYDPLDNDFEIAHMEGVFLRGLFTGNLRTRNRLYLLVMGLCGGALTLLSGVGIVWFFVSNFGTDQSMCCGMSIPGAIVGLAFLMNLGKNLHDLEEEREGDDLS